MPSLIEITLRSTIQPAYYLVRAKTRSLYPEDVGFTIFCKFALQQERFKKYVKTALAFSRFFQNSARLASGCPETTIFVLGWAGLSAE